MLSHCSHNIESQEEEILSYDRPRGKDATLCINTIRRRSVALLNSSPSDVHVEENKEDTEPQDGWVQPVFRAVRGIGSIESIEEKVSVDLWLDQHEVDEEHNIVMLDILVGKSLTVRTLGKANTFAQCSIVCFAIDSIKKWDLV